MPRSVRSSSIRWYRQPPLPVEPTCSWPMPRNTTTTVVVTYSDATSGINTEHFRRRQHLGEQRGATVTNYSAVGDVVTYTITAPSTNWGTSTQGTYTVSLVGGSVQDNVGNSVSGVDSFGSFQVDTI